MGSIRDPDADGVDEFPRRDRRDMADDRHEVALAPRLHLQHGEAVVFIVERHPLDGPDERFSGRCRVSGRFQEGKTGTGEEAAPGAFTYNSAIMLTEVSFQAGGVTLGIASAALCVMG